MISFRLALRCAVICRRLLPVGVGILLFAMCFSPRALGAPAPGLGEPTTAALGAARMPPPPSKTVRVPEDAPTIEEARRMGGNDIPVAPGVYRGNMVIYGNMININVPGNYMTIVRIYGTGPGVILEGVPGSGLPVIQILGHAVDISNMTIRGGEGPNGGGVQCNLDSRYINFTGCSFIGNRSGSHGGGLFGCTGDITNNRFEDNEAAGGGGALGGCTGAIRGNQIIGNRASYGGGIASCSGIIDRNRITSNTAQNGGGIAFCPGRVLNNMVVGNHAMQAAGGITECGTLLHNTIYGNTSAGAVGGVYGGVLIGNLVWANHSTQAPLNYLPPGSVRQCNWIEGNASEGGTLGGDPRVTSDSTGLIVPMAGSPLIDGATFQPEMWTDHLGARRPQFVTAAPGNGRGYDIGAIEVPGTFAHADVPTDAPVLEEPTVYASANPLLISKFLPTNGQVFNAAQWSIFLDGEVLLTTITLTTSTRVNLGGLLLDHGRTTCTLHITHWGATHLPSPVSAAYVLTLDPPHDVIGIPEAFARITDALRWADPAGAEIIVGPGLYREALDLSGRKLVLRSIDPASLDVRNSTIIDVTTATSALPAIRFDGSESSATQVAGLTLRGGRNSGVLGMGTHATLRHNLITGNSAYFWRFPGNGGGIHDVDGLIEFNEIAHNGAGSGAGLYGCDGLITHNHIHHNQASSPIGTSGAGLADCQGTISFNQILDNETLGGSSSAAGGGLSACNGPILHNLIQRNRVEGASAYGGGLASCAGIIQGNRIEANCVTAGSSAAGAGLNACGDLVNNIIAGNLLIASQSPYTQAQGAGVNGADRLLFNTIVDNHIESTAGGPAGTGGGAAGVSGLVQNNILWGNAATTDSQVSELSPTFCMIEDWPTSGVDGNSAANPLFVDAAAGDYHLRPISPAIDTALAMPEVIDDYAGHPRPQSRAGQPLGYDIGAYEWFSPLTFSVAGQWPPRHGAETVLQIIAEDVPPGMLAIEVWQTDMAGVARRMLTLKYVEMLGDTLDVSVETPPYLAGQRFTLRVVSQSIPAAWDESAHFDIQPINAARPDAWSLYR